MESRQNYLLHGESFRISLYYNDVEPNSALIIEWSQEELAHSRIGPSKPPAMKLFTWKGLIFRLNVFYL